MTGHQVRLPVQVHRVAVNGVSLASVLLLLGVADRIVATVPEVQANPWYQKVCPGIREVATPFSAHADLETLLRTRPDLVVLWSGNEVLVRQVESAGIPAFSVSYGNSNSFKQALRLLADIFGPGTQKRAEAYARYYDSLEALVLTQTQALPGSERKKVFYSADSPTNTEGRSSFINTWIQTAGGINVASEIDVSTIRIDVTAEKILHWNPDVVITRDARNRDLMQSGPAWQALAAVQQGRVYANPKGVNSWATRSGESALQILWAAQILHPQLFAHVDLSSVVRQFYQEFYGYSLSDSETVVILHPET